MTEKPRPPHPSTPDPERAGGPASHEDGLEATAPEPEGDEAASIEGSDPYDDLWDPDMDTRPERIKRTKARPKMDSRSRGRIPPRGKRREEA